MGMAPGWYPDQYDYRFEIYWDGVQWRGRREATPRAGLVPSPPSAFVGRDARNRNKRNIAIAVSAGTALILLIFVIAKIAGRPDQRSYDAGYTAASNPEVIIVGRHTDPDKLCGYVFESMASNAYGIDKSAFLLGCKAGLADHEGGPN